MSLEWLAELDRNEAPLGLRLSAPFNVWQGTIREGGRIMHCVGGCGTFIPQGQVGYFIGGDINLPVCRACAEKERGGPPPPPQPPLTPLYPGMFVGHLSDDQLLELLYYWPGKTCSELCGPDIYNVLWEIHRFSGTLTLSAFEYHQDGTRYYTRRDEGRQGSIRQFRALLGEKHICRDQLRWFPGYAFEYGVTGPAPLFMTEGDVTPWGEAQSIIHLTGGVYWVTTATHGGFMIAVHRAAQLLSQSALSIGELFGAWLCYDEDCACAVVIFEHQEWSHIFTNTDLIDMAIGIIHRYYPHYMQSIGSRG
jgi:hypothetical protein